MRPPPLPATIYTRDATAQWALLPSPVTNLYYIISLNDGRRLRNNGGDSRPGAISAPPELAVEWFLNGPNSLGYYYLENLPASQNIEATGTAPAISFGMTSDSVSTSATEWRLIKPYAPVTILTVTPPAVSISYSNQSAIRNVLYVLRLVRIVSRTRF